MDEYYRVKTTRTKQRNGAPAKQEKRKDWKRSDKRTQRDE